MFIFNVMYDIFAPVSSVLYLLKLKVVLNTELIPYLFTQTHTLLKITPLDLVVFYLTDCSIYFNFSRVFLVG